MAFDFAALNTATLAAFGEGGGVVFHVTAGSPPAVVDKPMEAAFRGPWNGTTVLGAVMDQQSNQLLVRTTDYVAAGVMQGSTVTARGAEWTVLDGQPDDGGMTLVSLAPVPA